MERDGAQPGVPWLKSLSNVVSDGFGEAFLDDRGSRVGALLA